MCVVWRNGIAKTSDAGSKNRTAPLTGLHIPASRTVKIQTSQIVTRPLPDPPPRGGGNSLAQSDLEESLPVAHVVQLEPSPALHLFRAISEPAVGLVELLGLCVGSQHPEGHLRKPARLQIVDGVFE